MLPGSRSRRAPLILAAILTAFIVVGAAFPADPLRDAETRATVTDAMLHLSPAFVALAPVNNTLDALSLLSLRQHEVLLVTLVCAYVVCRILGAWRYRRTTEPIVRNRRWIVEAWFAAVGLLVVFTIYAILALVPRPMAALQLAAADSNLVIIDFHSHTSASHDGRPGFTAEKNRTWHRAAGFDVAYVTDHYTFDGAAAGKLGNPEQAGSGTVLLSGIEALQGGEHLNVLGVTAADSLMFHGHYLARDPLDSAIMQGAPRPVIVLTMPGPLNSVPRSGMPDVVPVDAVEISDAAPRGLGADDREHAQILRLADSLGLALVAGSDNHGWGRTAAAWSVMEIPGWRRLTPDSLDRRIEETLASKRRQAARVIERVRPVWPARPELSGRDSAVAAMSEGAEFLGDFFWQLTTTRSLAERLSWLVWVWALALIYRSRRA